MIKCTFSVAAKTLPAKNAFDLLGFTLTQKPTIRIKSAWSVEVK